MTGYLIAEEGPLAGMTIAFDEEKESKEWSLGRDPDSADVTLEDPMVSRQHAIIRLTPEGYIFENLSTVNPATQNGMVIAEPILLKEGDILQIGSTFFHFTEKAPEAAEPFPELPEEMPSAAAETEGEEEKAELPSELHFGPSPDSRWLLKVISGPNAGAEFAMRKNSSYILGKDPNVCDVVFQDLSVSREHAKISIDAEENASVEDMGSRNGIIVNGELISDPQLLASQDLVALGTTTFLIIDRHEARETIIAAIPPAAQPTPPQATPEEEAVAVKAKKEKKDWKDTVIPKRHLMIAGVLTGVIFTSVFAMFTLFKSEEVLITVIDESEKIKEAIDKFPGVKFSFNQPSGKLFLIGHVLTSVEHQELTYLLQQMPFVKKVEDTVIVDELVWQNMNSLLSGYPAWIGVSVYAPAPGRFVLRGYLETQEEADLLSDYVHLNFEYLDLLETQVVVEEILRAEIQSMLLSQGFSAVNFELGNGEVILAGQIEGKRKSSFDRLVSAIDTLGGVRMTKNLVVVTHADMSRVDLSEQYAVTGYSKSDDKDYFVVINGRIVGTGDMLDGMKITAIMPKVVKLEREGLLYKIDFNVQ